ncbi:hypothetical protein LHP98_07050 [Rhodobacter sp. Har01]|uniref:COG4223 family protein n=1 Tax=Rhodobacter sp. Har01 TaxID=2883999 RepID=UPI001D0660EF|nr:hypothetical protein [Rhodobacter sp. Har01]MCB6177885.1 hypothetical protein [Rhodobacter sp. Har01]
MGGALAAGLGFGLSHFDLLKLRPAADDEALKQQIGTLATDIVTLRTDLTDRTAALDGALAAARTEVATATADLDARTTAALAGLTGLPDQMTALSARIDALDTALASAATQSSDGSVSQAGLAALTAAVETVKADLATLKAAPVETSDPETLRQIARDEMAAWESANMERVRAEEAAAEAAVKRAATLAALHQAAESGAPYAAELAALGDVAVPEIVKKYADAGMPTLARLTDAFAEPARAALDASLRAQGGGGGMGDRLWSFLRVQTGARSLTPREGSDPDAVLSRAEAALREGRVTDALTELTGLPPEGQAALADWMTLAKDHLAATDALATLKTP